MKVSLFLEISVPRPWDDDKERQMFNGYLDAVELADQVGFHAVWVTEHHFLEEYSAMSSPEVFLGAASQRTTRLRLGHGIVHMPPGVNHPARVAERISTLDLLSNGRVEFGTGEASSVAELDGFRIDPGKKREMWKEAVTVATRCMAESPFTGFKGEFVDMPPREVVPHPVQRPHPPVWVACTRGSTVIMAAEYGIGALSFAVAGPEEGTGIVKGYYEALERAVPLTETVNPNILLTGGNLMVADTDDEARRRIGTTGGFYGFGIGHYYVDQHKPGGQDLWQEYQRSLDTSKIESTEKVTERSDWSSIAKAASDTSSAKDFSKNIEAVGSPSTVREFLRRWEATGVDEVLFLLPPVDHEFVMDSIALLGKEVLPEFIERDAVHVAEKQRRLAPLVEKIMARKVRDAPALDPNYSFGGFPVSFDKTYRANEAEDAFLRGVKLAGEGVEA